MVEKSTKKSVQQFILVIKVLPILLAVIHFVNTIISFFYGNDILANYIGGISLLPVLYLYLASYTFKLCCYYRMYLHYCVVVNILNLYDYYIGIPLNNVDYFLLIIFLTIITLLLIIYLKFFK